ncbi:MAG: hypothetical protein ACHQ1D_00785 [Nitrososphaerales archaeon]
MARKDEKSINDLGLRHGKTGKVLSAREAGLLQSFLNSREGQSVSRGGMIKSGDIPLNIRSVFGAGDAQSAGLNPVARQAIQGMSLQNTIRNAMSMASPATNLIEKTTNLASGAVSQPTGVEQAATNFEPLQQRRTGGALRSLMDSLRTVPGVNLIPGINRPATVGGVALKPSIQDMIRDSGIGQGVMRAGSDASKNLRKFVFGTTEEEPIAEMLFQQYPELRGTRLRDVAGLTFQGTGNREFRINNQGIIQRVK